VRSCSGRAIDLEVPPGTKFNVDGEVVESGAAAFTVDAAAVEVVVG
jgi:diacylglycerol kinase family enzyme